MPAVCLPTNMVTYLCAGGVVWEGGDGLLMTCFTVDATLPTFLSLKQQRDELDGDYRFTSFKAHENGAVIGFIDAFFVCKTDVRS